MRISNKYVFFWRGWLSNFWHAPFELDGLTFQNTEQYFMWKKAITFNDQDIADKILATNSPKEARRLGQLVHGYSDATWGPIRRQVMYDCNFAKYTQNPDLAKELCKPEWRDKHFVEASPYDRIWAIGIPEEDDRCLDPANWLGTNYLGQCLDSVREQILNNEKSNN